MSRPRCRTVKKYNLDDFKAKEKCGKIIRKSKYEKQDPSVENWWNELFRDLENKFAVPNYKKKQHLKNCFSYDSLDELEKIGIEICDGLKNVSLEKTLTKIITESLSSKPSELGFFSSKKIPKRREYNPYLNFIKKPHTAAQIWRPQKPPSLKDLNLLEKSVRISDKIAADFDEWFQGMGGQRKSEINKELILELFQQTFDYPAATSLFVNIKELGSVTQHVADTVHRPQFSESEALRWHINRDSEATRKKPKMVAFGKTLPLLLRRKPVVEDIKDMWLKAYVYHDELASMQTMFEGVTDLQVTRSFCLWLLDNPEIPPPQYLVDSGFMDRKFLEKPIPMLLDDDTEESFGYSLSEMQADSKYLENLAETKSAMEIPPTTEVT